jgi:hypothetical protein
VIGTLDRSHKGEAAPTSPSSRSRRQEGHARRFARQAGAAQPVGDLVRACVKEMPTLDALAVRGRQAPGADRQPGFRGRGEGRPLLRRRRSFQKLQPYLDTEDRASARQLGVNLPTTILYDSQGREVWRMLGDTDWTGETAAKLIAEAS